MAEHSMKTEEQLLAAKLSDLNGEELQRRAAIIQIRKGEIEIERTLNENEKYQSQKTEAERAKRMNRESAEWSRRKIADEQAGCNHKTGGEGLAGMFNGDGAIYGTSTCGLVLPTGEVYYLCFRCQKEWHDPANDFRQESGKYRSSMLDVIEGKMSVDEWHRRQAEYNEVRRWPRKTFEPIMGEQCAASRFLIPNLESVKELHRKAFHDHLSKKKSA